MRAIFSIQRRFRAPTILASVLVITASTSQGAIIVHFVEEGTDVRISFSGTLNLGPLTEMGVIDDASHALSSNFIVAGGSGFGGLGGEIEVLPFSSAAAPPIVPNEILGFSFGFVVWSARHVTGETIGGTVTQLSADSSLDTFVLPDTSLATLNADADSIAEGAILWTSNAPVTDTFIFSRAAPVPEPTISLLAGVAITALFRRYR